MFYPSQIKDYIVTGLVSNFFNAHCKKVTSSLQKRKHHKFCEANVLQATDIQSEKLNVNKHLFSVKKRKICNIF